MEFSTNFITPNFVPYFQVILALLLGMILGIERVLAGRTAGPRTYGLVSLGACLITVVGINSLGQLGILGSRDPFPLLASIFNGIGFIGAGIIIFKNEKLSGLTTAAGIWVAAGIGMAVGFGYYLLSIFVTFVTLFVFSLMWRIERFITRHYTEGFLKEHQDTTE
ncbi:MAG: putative cation-transporting P-type ATPase [Candidatus Paceibacter sp.]|jgi:putative Mg2+ transporter-C (MgtC) family protein|nr:putative cation-transporting P-type ATPase [Candidatus Paceibacter sp.]